MAAPGPDALVVFDGVCNLCATIVRTIAALERRKIIAFSPVPSPYGRTLAAHFIEDEPPA